MRYQQKNRDSCQSKCCNFIDTSILSNPPNKHGRGDSFDPLATKYHSRTTDCVK